MFIEKIYQWLMSPTVPKSRQERRSSPLRLEHLETREVPAVSALLTPEGVLRIIGSDKSETIRVHQVNNQLSVAGTLIQQPGETKVTHIGGITIEEWSTSYSRWVSTSLINHIYIESKGGNDIIDLRSNSLPNSQRIRIPASIIPGSGNNTVWGTEANDIIYSMGQGNNNIYGMGGNDTIYAVVGRDRVMGGAGNDTIHAHISFHTLEAARNGRLFWNNSFPAGAGTDTIHVKMDVASFADRLYRPLVTELKAATHAFQPILNFLDRQVPVLSQYDSSLTYGRILSFGSSQVSTFQSVLQSIRSLSLNASLSGTINFGTFQVQTGTTPRVVTVAANPLSQISSSALNAARNLGIRFALLETPSLVMRMIMGHRVELVSYRLDLPRLEHGINRSYEVPTGLAGINAVVDFGARVWARAGATFGLDNTGFSTGNLLRGFFIRDAVAVVGATAHVKGGVTLGVPNIIRIASLKGVGQVSGSIHFRVGDGGSVYWANLPLDYTRAFRASGEIRYNLGIELGYARLRTSYTAFGIPYPEWVGAKHYRSLGTGTVRG
jgi:hypothetical protein